MRIYLDNNATTAIHPDVLAVLASSLRDVYGNASSIHKEGQTARRVIENARDAVATLIGATAREIVFTSGGTESNNAAIFGAVRRGEGFHIVTTSIEHPSVAEAVRSFDTTYVAPSRSGVVSSEDVIAAMRPETKLVTVMLANNETGVVQPVEAIGAVCRERGIHFHVDAVQGAGKIPIDVNAIQCDTLSLSAHKLHAPKGIGALYVRRGVTMGAHLVGGAQERRRRAGTENVPLAAAFGAAAALPMADVAPLRDRFEAGVRSLHVTVNGESVRRLPNTSNITFHGADGEGIVIALDLSGVAVSTGSACSSGRVEPSPVLLAMGLTPEEAKATVRFSLSRFTTEAEVDRVVALLVELVPRCARQ
ncbi:MAG TPA: cysteine desulfurase family protein [Thermoanaerobaculia bacterium]|jgi:cysteine desulfurase|nr:cysteine desulfurase family protein [Thermoanaerobaculia bacterium]